MIDQNWLNTTKEQDPNFAGSIHEKLGFDNAICPTCGTHLRNGICLNACHLTPRSRQRFSEAIRKATEANDETR